jgi:hypothetical protein
MQSLRNLLKKNRSSQKAKGTPDLDEKTVFFVFRKAIQKEFGEIGLEKIIPDYFSNKTLIIKSKSPAWAAELWTNREKVIRAVNKDLGEGSVDKIRIN